MIDYVVNMFRGFCMALADSVPGVSGGTIAFILGFYDKFIKSLNDLVFGKKAEKKVALRFLLKLGIGWVIGFVLAALVLTKLFDSHIYVVSSVFLGFIIFSIPLIMMQEKETMKGKYGNVIFTVIGIAIVALITYFNPVGGNEGGVDVGDLSIGTAIYVFLVAMVAISAMVLPGVSGSTLLLIFGLYIPIMKAIKSFLHLEMQYLPTLIIFGLGIVSGIVLVIRLIKMALAKFRSQTIYLIMGLMLGSLYAIVMGPTTLETPVEPLSWASFSVVGFIVGGGIILGLEWVKKMLERRGVDNVTGIESQKP